MTPPSAMTSVIFQTGSLQPHPSWLHTWNMPSFLTNLTLSLLSETTVCQTLLSTFLTILLRKCSHSYSWVSLSAMIFFWQATSQSWPPKPAANWASSVVQNPSLTHLNTCPHTSPLSTAWRSTALSSGWNLLQIWVYELIISPSQAGHPSQIHFLLSCQLWCYHVNINVIMSTLML